MRRTVCIFNFSLSLDCFPQGRRNSHSCENLLQHWVLSLFCFCQSDSWQDGILWICFSLIIHEIQLLLLLLIYIFFSVDDYSCSLCIFPLGCLFLLLWGALCVLWMRHFVYHTCFRYSLYIFLLTFWEILP